MKATATMVWLAALGLRCAAAAIPTWREWRPVAADVSALSAFSPQSVRVATAALCLAHASKLDAPANAACYRHHECRVANVDTQLALDDSSDWSCYQSPVCFTVTGEQFMFLQRVADPLCSTVYQAKCTIAGIRYQMVSASAPSFLKECENPFVQTDYGCVFLHTESKMGACGARRYCNLRGGDLASPRSLENFHKLAEWIMNEVGAGGNYWIGAHYRGSRGGWQYLRDGSSISLSSDLWYPGEPNFYLSKGHHCGRMKSEGGKYALADNDCEEDNNFVCQVFL